MQYLLRQALVAAKASKSKKRLRCVSLNVALMPIKKAQKGFFMSPNNFF
jgi:hypothetical protein